MSNENSDNADNPSEVVMRSVIGSPRCRQVSNKPRWLQTHVIDRQPKAANVSR